MYFATLAPMTLHHALLLLLWCACNGGTLAAAPEGGPMLRLDHATVTGAVSAAGDAELELWVEEPDSYVISPSRTHVLDHHLLFQLSPADASHPVSAYLAADKRSGEAFVVSGHPDGLARLLRKEPALRQLDQLGAVVDLTAPSPGQQVIAPSAEGVHGVDPSVKWLAPRVEAGETWRAEAMVLTEDGHLLSWSLTLPPSGPAKLTREVVATGVAVKR